MSAYKCTYTEVNRKPGTKTYGQLVDRVRKFETFGEAVSYSRMIASTNVNMIGKPVIDIEEAAE